MGKKMKSGKQSPEPEAISRGPGVCLCLYLCLYPDICKECLHSLRVIDGRYEGLMSDYVLRGRGGGVNAAVCIFFIIIL